MRISRCRRSQSSTAVTSAPSGGNVAPGAGTCSTVSSGPLIASPTAISPPAQRNTPPSPGCPPARA